MKVKKVVSCIAGRFFTSWAIREAWILKISVVKWMSTQRMGVFLKPGSWFSQAFLIGALGISVCLIGTEFAVPSWTCVVSLIYHMESISLSWNNLWLIPGHPFSPQVRVSCVACQWDTSFMNRWMLASPEKLSLYLEWLGSGSGGE